MPTKTPTKTPSKKSSKSPELPKHLKTIRQLSDRLVEAQKPIRILDACKWDDRIEADFFAADCKKLPKVTPEYYLKERALSFDLEEKRREFYQIEKDIRRELGMLNPAGELMLKSCKEYRVVLDLLKARGTADFSPISQGLFGSTYDRFHSGEPTLGELGELLSATLARLRREDFLEEEAKTIDAKTAVKILGDRMDEYFGPGLVKVKLSDGVVADAAAGSDYIKMREGAMFSQRDLDILEVHEGWVHVGTTMNGLLQPVLTFLGKGTPSCTITQEGLAIIQEVFTLRSEPGRIRKLSDRIHAIGLAEDGANFIKVYEALLERGNQPRLAYQITQRAFRGSLPEGMGPFTKDLTYSRGFVMIYNFVRVAVRKGLTSRIPLLFLGKLRLGDLGTLNQLLESGVVAPPRYLPPPYNDLRGLASWMCYSSFLNSIDLKRAEEDFASLLST